MPFRAYGVLVWFLLSAPLVSCTNARREQRSGDAEQVTVPGPVVDAYGAVIRGDVRYQKIALVFTADSFGDGGAVVRDALKDNNVKASFFLTGNFYANTLFDTLIRQLKDDGHYLGAHSDQHLLYADWNNRDSTLVTEMEFKDDVRMNYEKMSSFGIQKDDAPYFLPAYEWYNKDIVDWTNELGLQLINFTSGTLCNADYTYPQMGPRYRSSDEIYASVLNYANNEANGLNGFILLVHLGTDPRRTDKFYNRLDRLLKELKELDYTFVRIDDLINTNT